MYYVAKIYSHFSMGGEPRESNNPKTAYPMDFTTLQPKKKIMLTTITPRDEEGGLSKTINQINNHIV